MKTSHKLLVAGIIFLLGLVVSLSMVRASRANSSEWKVYRSSNLGVYFSYPSDWKVTEQFWNKGRGIVDVDVTGNEIPLVSDSTLYKIQVNKDNRAVVIYGSHSDLAGCPGGYAKFLMGQDATHEVSFLGMKGARPEAISMITIGNFALYSIPTTIMRRDPSNVAGEKKWSCYRDEERKLNFTIHYYADPHFSNGVTNIFYGDTLVTLDRILASFRFID
jgi:hypothetical protein